uniref:Uncharacterized protein n=1 Tax=Peronospora matthiolae TaxID=2874970 RepID=A0AAV1UUR8_9STRA
MKAACQWETDKLKRDEAPSAIVSGSPQEDTLVVDVVFGHDLYLEEGRRSPY